jgi:hypothetical protein
MFEFLAIDIKNLQIKLPPAVRAVFEPVGAIMVLNVTDAEFEAMRQDSSDPLSEVFAHEMYHCFQVYTSGYQFQRVGLLCGAFFTEYADKQRFGDVLGQLFGHFLGKLFMKVTSWLPARYRFLLQARYVAELQLRDQAELQELATRGQPSMIGADFPGLYRKLSELKQETLQAGEDGLSPNDLLEGSAAVYARFSCQTAPSSITQLLDYLDGLTETYSRALKKTADICGERAKNIILPAAALALRYERPENAYCEIVRRIAASTPGKELASAKKLGTEMPRIEKAGGVLGTARQFCAKTHSRNRVYAEQIHALESGSWGIDELDLLTSPSAIGAIPPGSLGFGIRTLESVRGPHDGLVIATIMLRGGPSIYHLQTESMKSTIDLASELLGLPVQSAR